MAAWLKLTPPHLHPDLLTPPLSHPERGTHAPTDAYPCSFLSNHAQVANVEVDGNNENVYAVIRYVEAPNMRVGKHTVQDYNDYVTATHKANMGRNSGWDRYVDFHLGRYHSTPPEGSGCS